MEREVSRMSREILIVDEKGKPVPKANVTVTVTEIAMLPDAEQWQAWSVQRSALIARDGRRRQVASEVGARPAVTSLTKSHASIAERARRLLVAPSPGNSRSSGRRLSEVGGKISAECLRLPVPEDKSAGGLCGLRRSVKVFGSQLETECVHNSLSRAGRFDQTTSRGCSDPD